MFSRNLRMELKAVELRNVELTDRILGLVDEKLSIGRDRDNFQSLYKQQKMEIKTLGDRVKNLQETVRDQTEADLLLNALKAIGVIPKEEKEPDSFGEALRLQQQLALARRQSQAISSPSGGFFG